MVEWDQLRVVGRAFFADEGLLSQKSCMLGPCPKIYANHGTGMVQSFKNGKGKQEVPESTLVDDSYLPGLIRTKGTLEVARSTVCALFLFVPQQLTWWVDPHGLCVPASCWTSA